MPRLLHDRYLAFDDTQGCDLVTGQRIRLDRIPAATAAESPVSGVDAATMAPLVEVLDDARDGAPRWLVARATTALEARRTARALAGEARRRGFIPVLVSIYVRLGDQLKADLTERTLLLIDTFESGDGEARAALLRASATCARPHVLLTFRSGAETAAPWIVREAPASCAPGARTDAAAPAGPSPVPLSGDVAVWIDRALRAAEWHRAGRHVTGERALREAIGALSRRGAHEPARQAAVVLGRLLLERGRAVPADRAFDEAATYAQQAQNEPAMLDARLWQAAAKSDAARLSDAESICRAVLLASDRTPGRRAWADALLARVLLWQGRLDEAVNAHVPAPLSGAAECDPVVAAASDATAVRVLVAAGQLFQAGVRARALVAAVADSDVLVRLIAAGAHLRVLSAAGDLDLAAERLREVNALARAARAPLRAARAAQVWCAALRLAGRAAEAERICTRLERLHRVAPPLLKRSLELARAAGTARPTGVTPTVQLKTSGSGSTFTARLLRLVQEEEDDEVALKRLLECASEEVQSARLDLLSRDAGPISTMATTGNARPTRIGTRVVDTGMTVSDEIDGGREMGVPVRYGSKLLGALVARWPVDRPPDGTWEGPLQTTATIVAFRLDALLAARRQDAQASTSVPELLGLSAVIDEVRRAIARAARAPFAVLVDGESGVGKELAARAIHQLGPRRERKFCDVNCAALPDELVESELFGHVRGAFTGAVVDKPGIFEEANGGTLFLDEVADLSPRGQAKLLRVIQQHEVRRVGETFSRKVDVRLVTAANRDMRAEAAAGRFRIDLLYRLDVIRIHIPALRERPEDIPVLAQHFWKSAAARVGSTASLSHRVLSDLAAYSWPGNVRELQNVLAALAVAAPCRGSVRAALLPAAITGATRVSASRLADARAEFERRCVEVALARAGGRRGRAAAALGLSRQGLLKTMARLGLDGAPGDDRAS